MIKAILVDDEKHALESLKMLLGLYFPDKFEILALCNSVDQAIPEIQRLEPDLVFLDIQMPQKNGFDLLEIIPNRNFDVIFTTAHGEHAIKAFKHGTFDYLLKPIDAAELQKTILRYEEKRKSTSLESTLNSIHSQLNALDIIELNSQDSIEYVNIHEILYLKAGGNYTEVCLEDGRKILQSKPLGYFEKKLESSKLFNRIHHKYLANTTKFRRYDKKEGFLILKDGTEVSVSIRKGANLSNGFI